MSETSTWGSVVGLFAGIGGIELGLQEAGYHTELLCEIEPGAQAVLRTQFPSVTLTDDVRELSSLPPVDLVTAGFPCQDLSQAGRTAGIGGQQSGLVDHVFRLIEPPGSCRWLLLENVSFMLQLDRGQAMQHLTTRLQELGFAWAYRVVDSRAFGLPQRRLRVLLLASRTDDPREVLFADTADPVEPDDHETYACGFYWTEGTRGLGWAVDAIPTLKGGSALGIASPPAVRLADSRAIVTPGITDAERLQGFPPGWTTPAVDGGRRLRRGHRWKLVGNAVSVPVATWLGGRLHDPKAYDASDDRRLRAGEAWPVAAWSLGSSIYRAKVSRWPVCEPYQHLGDFLEDAAPLSARATAGFLRRARASRLRFVKGFLADVEAHLIRMGGDPPGVPDSSPGGGHSVNRHGRLVSAPGGVAS
jgi:DNA (cytosine-5)-methyltransferase 1